jgi:hypothetical protein
MILEANREKAIGKESPASDPFFFREENQTRDQPNAGRY